MNYKIEHAGDGSIRLTKLQPNIHSNPGSIKPGERDPETGWTFKELQALGERERYDLKHKVRILVRSKGRDMIEVEPGAAGPMRSMTTTEQVRRTGQGDEGRHTYSGLSFSELESLAEGQEHWVEKSL